MFGFSISYKPKSKTIHGDNRSLPSSVNGVKSIVNRREPPKHFGPNNFKKKGFQYFHAPSSSLPTSLTFPQKIKKKRIKKNLKAHPHRGDSLTPPRASNIDYLYRRAAGFRCLLHRKDINHRAWWVCFSSYISYSFFVIRIKLLGFIGFSI